MVTQNIERFKDGIYDYTKEFDLTRKPFNFYGAYVRINEDQKYKVAETKVVKYYISIIDQMVMKNQSSDEMVKMLYDLNRRIDDELRQTRKDLDEALQAKLRMAEDYQKIIK